MRERYYEKVSTGEQTRVNILSTLGGALKCPPFVAQLAIALAFGISTSMLGGIGYNLTVFYVCDGNETVGGQSNMWMSIAGTFLGILGAIGYAKFAKAKSKRASMFAVLMSGIVVFLASWFSYNPAMPALQLLAAGSIAFVTAGLWTMYRSIGADIVDYDELETGKRREGAFAECGSYLMKFGRAFGSWASGKVLASAGFDPAKGGDQGAETIWHKRMAFAGIPIFGIIVALAALAVFGLTKAKSAEIREALEARRGSV